VRRHVLAESHEIPDIVQAVTTYVARRLVERQRALEENPDLVSRTGTDEVRLYRRRRRWRMFGAVVIGFIAGALTLLVAALLMANE
jgi:hypothetical protein